MERKMTGRNGSPKLEKSRNEGKSKETKEEIMVNNKPQDTTQ